MAGKAGRPFNNNLAAAKLAGDKTYEGSVHAACGTSTRYTSGGGCVHCAREKQKAMREALVAANAPPEPTHAPGGEPAFEENYEEIEERDLTAEAGPAYTEPWD